jgi:hypothetical protein
MTLSDQLQEQEQQDVSMQEVQSTAAVSEISPSFAKKLDDVREKLLQERQTMDAIEAKRDRLAAVIAGDAWRRRATGKPVGSLDALSSAKHQREAAGSVVRLDHIFLQVDAVQAEGAAERALRKELIQELHAAVARAEALVASAKSLVKLQARLAQVESKSMIRTPSPVQAEPETTTQTPSPAPVEDVLDEVLSAASRDDEEDQTTAQQPQEEEEETSKNNSNNERKVNISLSEQPGRVIMVVTDPEASRAKISATSRGVLTVAVPGAAPASFEVDPSRFDLHSATKEAMSPNRIVIVIPKQAPAKSHYFRRGLPTKGAFLRPKVPQAAPAAGVAGGPAPWWSRF